MPVTNIRLYVSIIGLWVVSRRHIKENAMNLLSGIDDSGYHA